MVFFAEAYLSALLRYDVFDAEGRPLGHLDDVLVRPDERFPEVTRIAVRPRGSRGLVYYPWSLVRTASAEGMRLHPQSALSARPAPEADEMPLRRELLDQQIVDVSGKRVVRVHDLKLGAVSDRVLLTHADVGWRGVLRRMGWEHFTLGLGRVLHMHFPERLIAWEHLQMPAPDGHVAANESREALRHIHPADLADIAEELSAPERAAFLGSMDEEVAADAMQEMETEALVAAVNELSDQQASGLIDEMDPDAGADLLAELPEERANALLDLMDPEEAADLRHLLTYPEDSAGGLMTTEQISVPGDVPVSRALELVRAQSDEAENVYYVHVVDAQRHLLGILSLWELITAEPQEQVSALMHTHVVTVTPDTGQQAVAAVAARYNLLAVPVVDEASHLLGIVTADDAIDAVIPTSWKKRIPKAFGK